MSTKPYITVITDCMVFDENGEGPQFVALQLDQDDINSINAYRKALDVMKSDGLAPHSIDTYQHTARFISVCNEHPLKEDEKKTLRFFSSTTESEWDACFTSDGEESSSLDSFTDIYRIEDDMMTITNDNIYISGYIKYTDINVKSVSIDLIAFNKICQWIKEIN